MPNLTVAIDSETIKQAKLRAVQEGTSLSDKVRGYLRRYAQGQDESTVPDLSFAENALLFSRQKQAGGQRPVDIVPAPTAPNGISVDPDYLRRIRGWARDDIYDDPKRHGPWPPQA